MNKSSQPAVSVEKNRDFAPETGCRAPASAHLRAVALALLLISGAGYAPVSGAAPCSFVNPDKTCQLGSTGWLASWDSDDIKLSFEDRVVGQNKGILTKVVTFNSLAPLTITFTEEFTNINPNPPSNSNLGFRITMNEIISNKSGSDWKGFNIIFKQLDDLNVRNTADHPNAAHAHPDARKDVGGVITKGYDVGPFTKVLNTDGDKSDLFVATSNFSLDGLLSVNLSDGIFADGMLNVNWNGIGIHDWEAQDSEANPLMRLFTMTEQPVAVPVPATWLLLGGGLAGLAVAGRRRRA